ncbi:MAG: hypothetical protein JXR40_12255 [Pontiellaceae bacterium]|nr:hypothetical protein [Pontiellaceae bacterium]
MRFSIALFFFTLPMQLGKLDFVQNHPVFEVLFYACMILLYLPFAVLWASKMVNLKPPEQGEIESARKKKQEQLEQLDLDLLGIDRFHLGKPPRSGPWPDAEFQELLQRQSETRDRR